jgi:hypothetical protein
VAGGLSFGGHLACVNPLAGHSELREAGGATSSPELDTRCRISPRIPNRAALYQAIAADAVDGNGSGGSSSPLLLGAMSLDRLPCSHLRCSRRYAVRR